MISARGDAARTLFLLLLALCLPACRSAPEGPIELTILYTNDIHGYALPEPASWVKKEPKPLVGGLAAMEHAIAEERQKAPNSLLLFGGDALTGQPCSRFVYQGVKGGYVIAGMNLLGYDAACVGNHEFDGGLSNLKALIERSSFPWLAANMKDGRADPIKFGSHQIFERGGLRIAVIGLITPQLGQLIDPRAIEKFTIEDPAQTLQPTIDKLRKSADLIVLLTHIGVDGDKALARKLKGVDVIVGGHSHTRLSKPLVENGVLICQAGCYARNLGVAKLKIEKGKVTQHEVRLRTLWYDDKLIPTRPMASLVRQIQDKVDGLMSDRLGVLKSPWKRSRTGESNTGTFLADCIRRAAAADVGMLNSGGIRTELPAGPISRGQLITVLPFSNKLVLFKVSGEQLSAICKHNALAAATGDHGVLQLSGVKYHWRKTGAKQVALSQVTVGGKPLDPKRVYVCATNDYVAFYQPMKYLGLVPTHREMRNVIVADAVAERIQQLKVVDARVQGVMVEDPSR